MHLLGSAFSFLIIAFVLLFLAKGGAALVKKALDGKILGNEASVVEAADSDASWNLILVNKEHPIPDGYEVNLLKLDNGEQVDERIYPQLQAMFDDARADGLELFVAAGYRTQEKQQALMEKKILSLVWDGYLPTDAVTEAAKWVAAPGTSEHQLGIAVDINANTEISSSEEVFGWLSKNAANYGFIQRYPAGKEDITGISNEPWHYRYVGQEAAQEISSQGLCLEEYLNVKK